MNRKKTIGIIIIIIGVFLIAGIIFTFTAFYGDNTDPDTPTDPGATVEPDTPTTPKPPTRIKITPPDIPPTSTPKDVTEEELRQIARSFAERFGSYSNQSDFSNINDLRMFMSQKMKNWAESFVREQREKKTNNDIYYGITTKSVSEKVQKYDKNSGQAEIMVQTRRRESTGTRNNSSNVYNQEILFKFIKEKGAWKVDSAYWQ